jgi:hypothetical protein
MRQHGRGRPPPHLPDCPSTCAPGYFTAFHKLCSCGTICITQLMDEVTRTSSPEWSAADTGKWIVRVVIAVILAEGIWGFIAALTNNLILPLLARTMGGDVQSPLYLGKGDVNVPALFASVLELCFAGIAAVILNSFLQSKAKVIRSKPARVSPVSPLSIAPEQPIAPPLSQPAVMPVKAVAAPTPVPPVITYSAPEPPAPLPTPPTPVAAPSQFVSSPAPAPPPKAAAPPATPKAPAKPQKPKPPKEIYYNIVGEPINPTEDD